MWKLTFALTALLSTAALAQEAPAPAVAAPDFCANLKDVPKAKGVMLLALRDKTVEYPFSSAQACETERCRLKAQNIGASCIWIK